MQFRLPARDHVVMDWAPALYMIRVDGHLGALALSAFPAMTPHQKGTHTVLTGWLDQSALYGVLAEMEAIGLVLLEVRKSPISSDDLPSSRRRSLAWLRVCGPRTADRMCLENPGRNSDITSHERYRRP
jgi:hypothetical protein